MSRCKKLLGGKKHGFRTVGFRVQQRETDLSGGGVRASTSCNSRHRLQREKRLSFKVVTAQGVVVQHRHQQARSGRLTLLQRHSTAPTQQRRSVNITHKHTVYTGLYSRQFKYTKERLPNLQNVPSAWPKPELLAPFPNLFFWLREFTYNSNDSSNNGLRSRFLTLVDRGSSCGKFCLGSRDSWTKGSLKPVQ